MTRESKRSPYGKDFILHLPGNDSGLKLSASFQFRELWDVSRFSQKPHNFQRSFSELSATTFHARPDGDSPGPGFQRQLSASAFSESCRWVPQLFPKSLLPSNLLGALPMLHSSASAETLWRASRCKQRVTLFLDLNS